jgi:high-affinity nickel-transport protein
MLELPNEWGALCAVVFGLGLRHGVDADHLAAIDALTRVQIQAGRRTAARCGMLFAAGHGAVVLAVAAAVGALADPDWLPPALLAGAGTWLSTLLLLGLGLASLHGLLRGAPRAGWAGRLANGRHAALAVGALFAVSLDTVALAALFGLTGLQHGGAFAGVGFGLLFAAAMALVDGANGWWIARLQQRGGTRAALLTRAVGWSITVFTLALAAFGLMRLLPGAAAPALATLLVAALARLTVQHARTRT